MKFTGFAAAAAMVAAALLVTGCASTPATQPSTPPAAASTPATDPSPAPSSEPATTDPSSAPSSEPTATADAAGTCEYVASSRPASKAVELPPTTPVATGQVTAVMKTSIGDLTLTLDADKAPCTVNSFISLANQGYFNDTVCHRLTTNGIYVLQCGDPSATGSGGPGYSFADELDPNEDYPAGTLAMANAGPNTNGSQFFMVYKDAPGALAPNYSPFGSFDQSAIDLIAKVAADGNAANGIAPKTEVQISAVEIK